MEQHLPADSPEKFRFRAESLRSASAGKQAHKGQRQTPSPQDSLFLREPGFYKLRVVHEKQHKIIFPLNRQNDCSVLPENPVPPGFFFAAVHIQIHPHRKQACCLYAAQRRSAAFSALSAGILLPQRRAAFSAAVGASSMAMTAGTARRAQSSVLPVF